MTDAVKVTLYGREGCHLCDEAKDGLLGLRAEGSEFELIEIDIESDRDLLRKYLERIPVIEIQGQEVCELGIDHTALRARLASL